MLQRTLDYPICVQREVAGMFRMKPYRSKDKLVVDQLSPTFLVRQGLLIAEIGNAPPEVGSVDLLLCQEFSEGAPILRSM